MHQGNSGSLLYSQKISVLYNRYIYIPDLALLMSACHYTLKHIRWVCFLLHHITNLFRSSQKYIFIDIFYLSATWNKHNHQDGLFTVITRRYTEWDRRADKGILCSRGGERSAHVFHDRRSGAESKQSYPLNNSQKTETCQKSAEETAVHSDLVDVKQHIQRVTNGGNPGRVPEWWMPFTCNESIWGV